MSDIGNQHEYRLLTLIEAAQRAGRPEREIVAMIQEMEEPDADVPDEERVDVDDFGSGYPDDWEDRGLSQ
jgi:hypothetical protein